MHSVKGHLNGSVKEPNKFHNYETEKITRKASDAAEYNRVVWFFHPRSSCTTRLMLFSECPSIYASSCMTVSGGRTEQHIVIGFGELAAVN